MGASEVVTLLDLCDLTNANIYKKPSPRIDQDIGFYLHRSSGNPWLMHPKMISSLQLIRSSISVQRKLNTKGKKYEVISTEL